jgi:hypothetical protein
MSKSAKIIGAEVLFIILCKSLIYIYIEEKVEAPKQSLVGLDI